MIGLITFCDLLKTFAVFTEVNNLRCLNPKSIQNIGGYFIEYFRSGEGNSDSSWLTFQLLNLIEQWNFFRIAIIKHLFTFTRAENNCLLAPMSLNCEQTDTVESDLLADLLRLVEGKNSEKHLKRTSPLVVEDAGSVLIKLDLLIIVNRDFTHFCKF